MRAGNLNGVIDIEHCVITGVSPINEPIYDWKTWREDIFCEVKSKRGREHFENEQRYSETITQFTTHLTEVEGVDAAMRIRFEGQYYDIKAILPDHQDRISVIIDATLQDGSVQGSEFSLFAQPALTATVGQIYQTLVTIVGGEAPFTAALADGDVMPPGLYLVQAQDKVWALEGIPTQAGSYPLTIQGEDGQERVAVLPEFVLVVSPP